MIEVDRGLLSARSPLDRALEAIIERSEGNMPVNIHDGLLFEDMAWAFPGGEIKELNACSKEELLNVCKVLVRKISTVHDSLCHVRLI